MQVLTLTQIGGVRRAPSFFARLKAARALARQRAALAHLDDEMLSDIGLTREQATREAARPVWDAPSYWRA